MIGRLEICVKGEGGPIMQGEGGRIICAFGLFELEAWSDTLGFISFCEDGENGEGGREYGDGG